MLKAKVSFFVLILLCFGLPAKAECWQWTTNGIPAAMDYSPNRLMWMAFDEQQGRPAILLQKSQSSYELELWHYDGRTWCRTWNGTVVPPRGFFAGPGGLYFDPNQNALIMLPHIRYGFEIASTMAFKYVEGQGWVYLAETVDSCITWNVLPVYDSKRGRAVLVLSYCSEGYYFVEFDGFQFHYVEINREEFNFEWGVAGYNAEAERVLFFGETYFSHRKTYEYDGSTWVMVETPVSPPRNSAIHQGLPFIPEMSGMLLYVEPYDGEQPLPREIWIYKDQNWMMQPYEGRTPVPSDLPMCFDPARKRVVLLEEILQDGRPSILTWELRKTRHCRSLGKP